MDKRRTPDSRFDALPDYAFAPNDLDVPDPDGGTLRMHYVDEGPGNAPPALMLHGNPDWSYSFRSLIATVSGAGFRAIAPDTLRFIRESR